MAEPEKMTLAEVQESLTEWNEQANSLRALMEAEPDNDELKAMMEEVEATVAPLEERRKQLLELAETQTAEPETPTTVAEPTKKSLNNDNFASKTNSRRANDPQSFANETAQAPFQFHVNDEVLAQWISGDRAFYGAKITSITGSPMDPVVQVKFKKYNATETLRRHNIKAFNHHNNASKSAPKATASNNSNPITPNNSNVISAAPNVDQSLVAQAKQAKRAREEDETTGQGGSRAAKSSRKVSNNKALEAKKSNWKDFQSKGKMSKGPKQESMFRTTEKGRVGFVNSGNAMRKDAPRQRNTYQPRDNEDDEGGEDDTIIYKGVGGSTKNTDTTETRPLGNV